MKKQITKVIIIFIIATFLVPIIITLSYWVGKIYPLIPDIIPAGNLTQYFGSIISAAIAIYALMNTIKYNEKSFQINLKKGPMEKLYSEVCDMATKIMNYLGLVNTFTETFKINGSLATDVEKAEQIRVKIWKTIEELIELNMKQWYYYARLKNEGCFDDRTNNDVVIVRSYFRYIWYLIDTDQEDGRENCLVTRFNNCLLQARDEQNADNKVDIYVNFIRELSREYHGTKEDSLHIKYNHYRIKEETKDMTKSLKEIIYLQIKND